MRRYSWTLSLLVMLLASASLQGCVGTTTSGHSAGRRWCNSSSYSCMVLRAEQSKRVSISGQQVRCCS